ncbi:DNA-3-methyladenine glycosylase family protein [Williamsia sterculiae]|uniref:3-methyladenine DNA glycosylase/8-oxoguanine DNA glycosylase n=1 Tax=Williamsia sterculiae TaxID=1344003 RepID=A0A1N7EXW0_9NOCA|nr:3-methyladenine DNA glycosylase [Williamsia sterculiae]SIR92916.1 3-methyladenine DNA glycosylase/8-oxoguanine DNA glycosylase [Williamsia sterculiae]
MTPPFAVRGEKLREWRPPWPLDIRATVGLHRRGSGDPAFRYDGDGSVWRTSHTPEGPGTLRISARAGVVTGRAWGAGGDWLLEGMPALLGADDHPEELVTDHPVVSRMIAMSEGLRIGRTDRVWEALAPAVLEQKVLGIEAWRAWRYLLYRHGEPAPGRPDMRVPPPQQVWREIPSWDWHRSGAEPVRMRTIWRATAMNVERHPDRLTLLSGVGPWTESETRCRAVGDADCVPVGDYHIPGLVGFALTGTPVDDDGMLDLLEPFAGHRFRVIRMIERHSRRPERRGPRLAMRDYRGF